MAQAAHILPTKPPDLAIRREHRVRSSHLRQAAIVSQIKIRGRRAEHPERVSEPTCLTNHEQSKDAAFHQGDRAAGAFDPSTALRTSYVPELLGAPPFDRLRMHSGCLLRFGSRKII